jgi:hypothetical protein
MEKIALRYMIIKDSPTYLIMKERPLKNQKKALLEAFKRANLTG